MLLPMKTKTFLLLCLFLGMGLTQLSSQNGKNGSGTTKSEIAVENWTFPVFCDGVEADLVNCPNLTVGIKVHYINGVEVWGINKVKFQPATSLKTSEVYKMSGYDHWSDVKGYDKFYMHLVGDRGNNISMHITIDLTTFEFVDIQSNCH